MADSAAITSDGKTLTLTVKSSTGLSSKLAQTKIPLTNGSTLTADYSITVDPPITGPAWVIQSNDGATLIATLPIS